MIFAVSNTNANSNNEGFYTIQSALDEAGKSGSLNITLLIRQGMFALDINAKAIRQSPVRLTGEDKQKSIIDIDESDLKSGAETFECKNLTVRSYKLKKSDIDALSNFTFKDCLFDDGSGAIELNDTCKPQPSWYVCGDSIAADYPSDKAPMTGWGQALSLIAEDVRVENCAMCGRSSKSFVSQSRLSHIELCLNEGDKLLISFSHNDEKPNRLVHTEPFTTFWGYLNMYIDAAIRRGAEPILITPMPRRHYDENGSLMRTHAMYPDAIKALAALRGVKLVDLERKAEVLMLEEGMEQSVSLYCHVPEGHINYPDGVADNSHLSIQGASEAARIIYRAIKRDNQTEETPANTIESSQK